MSGDTKDMQFTWADVEEWADAGLISPDQVVEIRHALEAAAPKAPPVAAAVEHRGSEQRPGFNLVTIAYYFGGFTILLAYTLFLGLQWQTLGYALQCAITAVTMLVLLGIGYFLRHFKFPQAGALLIFVGVGITPLLVYTLAQATGIWPSLPSYDNPNYSNAYDNYVRAVRPFWILIEITSLMAAAIAIWWVRFPLITLLASFWGWLLTLDLVRLVSNESSYYGDRDNIVSTIVGAVFLALGVVLQRRTQQDYSRWLYLAGHLLILENLGMLALRNEGLLALGFLLVYLAFVVASVWLKRPIFLVFGAIGCYSYIGYLSFHTFEGSTGFPIALAFVGLSIVLTAVGYQKYGRPWLEQRFDRHHVEPPEQAAEAATP
jgi:hypothetical protein